MIKDELLYDFAARCGRSLGLRAVCRRLVTSGRPAWHLGLTSFAGLNVLAYVCRTDPVGL
jgi:hypothetical protein